MKSERLERSRSFSLTRQHKDLDLILSAKESCGEILSRNETWFLLLYALCGWFHCVSVPGVQWRSNRLITVTKST